MTEQAERDKTLKSPSCFTVITQNMLRARDITNTPLKVVFEAWLSMSLIGLYGMRGMKEELRHLLQSFNGTYAEFNAALTENDPSDVALELFIEVTGILLGTPRSDTYTDTLGPIYATLA